MYLNTGRAAKKGARESPPPPPPAQRDFQVWRGSVIRAKKSVSPQTEQVPYAYMCGEKEQALLQISSNKLDL